MYILSLLIIVRSQVEEIGKLFSVLQAKVPTMQHIAKLFSDPNSDESNAFNEVLVFLSEEVRKKSHDFSSWMENCLKAEAELKGEDIDLEAVQEYSDEIEQLMAAILIVIQKLRKHHVKDTDDSHENSPDDGNCR